MYDEAFLRRLEDRLRGALPAWGLDEATDLRLLTISENATFRARTAAGEERIFRVHRPDYHTRAEIASELAWISALKADGAVATPAPIPLLDGSLIADVEDDGHLRHVVSFEFVAGREPSPEDALAPWFRELGRVHAHLHSHAEGWRRPPDFVRKVWNFQTMVGDRPLWGDWRAGLGLDTPGRALLDRTIAVLDERLRAYGEGGDRFGLVHADLRLANLLVDGDRLSLIDFDDCGFSWFLYDFAAAISFIEHDPQVPDLLASWCEGYRETRRLSPEDEAMMPVFVMLRRILLTAWVASHAETPTAEAMGVPYTHGTLDLAEAFLSRRR